MIRYGRKLYQKHSYGIKQFIKFGIVGGSGFLVNFAVLWICLKIGHLISPSFKPDTDIVWAIPYTEYNVRWYHMLLATSFLVANLWNFQLNRWWAFKTSGHAKWWKEYWPFLLVGLIALAIGLVITTVLLNPKSPIALPRSVFDGSSGLRKPLYWANLIMIIATTPIAFLFNKFWTFKAIRKIEGDLEEQQRKAVSLDTKD